MREDFVIVRFQELCTEKFVAGEKLLKGDKQF